MGWDMKERRRFPRATHPCKIIIKSRFFQNDFITQTKNISAGGVRVILERRFKPSDNVQIEVFLKDGVSVKCEGEVAWSIDMIGAMENVATKFDTGIQFTVISDVDRESISNFVDAILAAEKSE